MHRLLKRFILLSLHACDGLPMPQGALISAVQTLARPGQPTQSDVLDALKGAEGDGYVQGATDDLADTTWTLTTAGIHKARSLR